MTSTLAILNAVLLLACTSMYFGTGWSLLLFQFPIIGELRPENYYSHFVPQVEAATRFFTGMTLVMLVSGSGMTYTEWGQPAGWAPIVVLAGVVAATLLTTQFILPYNRRMKEGITDHDELHDILRSWTALNRVRVGLWTVQWTAMVIWFMENSW